MIGKNQTTKIQPEQYPEIAQFLSRFLETGEPLLEKLKQPITLTQLHNQMTEVDKGWAALLEILKTLPEDDES